METQVSQLPFNESGLIATTLSKQINVQVQKRTRTTPQVRYNENMHLLWISGSYKISSGHDFIDNIIEIVHEHFQHHDFLRVVLDLTQVNGAATRSLMRLFNILKNYERRGTDVLINWVSPWEEDLYLIAFDLSELYGLKVEIRPY